jgi:hypothetical protein
MSAAPDISPQGIFNLNWTIRQDFGNMLETKAEGTDEPGQNQSEPWKKMCFLIISTLVEQTEQQPIPTMKSATESTANKDIHSQKTPAKGGSQRAGGRSSRSHSDHEDEERDGRKKRKLSTENDDTEIRRRLKCPFYLRRPEKHRRGSCRGEGFADMGKLK